MKIPNKFRVMGLDWTVVYDAELEREEEKYGCTNHRTQVVTISSSIPQQLKEQVFMHELLHVLFWSIGLQTSMDCFQGDDGKNEEAVVDALSNGLFSFVKENPEAWQA